MLHGLLQSRKNKTFSPLGCLSVRLAEKGFCCILQVCAKFHTIAAKPIDSQYTNFDLSFEWKISKAGNSGVFINVLERPDLGTTFLTGPEYQLLDDKNMDADYVKDSSHKAASIFGVIANTSNTIPRSGEWNQSRIL